MCTRLVIFSVMRCVCRSYENIYLILAHYRQNGNHNLRGDVGLVPHPHLLLAEPQPDILGLVILDGLEKVGGLAVKSAELAKKNLLVQSGFHLVLEDGVLRPGFSFLESGYDVDVHIRLFVEIKAVAQSELLEFCLLTVGLLLLSI